MTPYLLVPPAAEPLTLAEAKAWLRLDSNDEDTTVSALIVAARMAVEQAARRLLVHQSWRIVADRWPDDGVLRLPLAPVAAITAIRVRDAEGTPQTVSPAAYRAELKRDPARLVLTAPVPLPGLATSGIEIDVTAGFSASPAEVPEPLRHAMRLLLARWFDNRGDIAADAATLPADVALLVSPYCRPRL